MPSLAAAQRLSITAGDETVDHFLRRLAPADLRLRFGGKASLRDLSALRRRLGIGDPHSTVFLSLTAEGTAAALATLASTSVTTAEAAVIVRSDLKCQGYGTALMANLIDQARARGLMTLAALALYENLPARRMLRRLGFRQIGPLEAALQFELELSYAPAI